MRLLHRDVELDFGNKRTGQVICKYKYRYSLISLLYRFFDTRITAK